MARRTTPPRPPAAPPADAAEGAGRIRVALVKLFDRGDGTGMDWHLTAESLFRCAFDLLDKLPEETRQAVARWVHEGSYRRMVPESVEGNSTAGNSSPAGSVPAPSNTAGLKSNGPRPPH
jgi:hypothetical protein